MRFKNLLTNLEQFSRSKVMMATGRPGDMREELAQFPLDDKKNHLGVMYYAFHSF